MIFLHCFFADSFQIFFCSLRIGAQFSDRNIQRPDCCHFFPGNAVSHQTTVGSWNIDTLGSQHRKTVADHARRSQTGFSGTDHRNSYIFTDGINSHIAEAVDHNGIVSFFFRTDTLLHHFRRSKGLICITVQLVRTFFDTVHGNLCIGGKCHFQHFLTCIHSFSAHGFV